MICCAEQRNQIKPAEGNSGLRPFCTTTSAGFFIGDKMKTRKDYNHSEKRHASYKCYSQTEKGKIVQRNKVRRYKLRHPEQCKARNAVKIAIRANKLVRPDSLQCLCCYKKAELYHHKSYAPKHRLNIIPLCRKCHRIIHTYLKYRNRRLRRSGWSVLSVPLIGE